MPPPRIFLSHSSKDAALTAKVTKALQAPDAAQGHPGYEVLVDTDCLQAGEQWPVQLHAMMAYAHAGLILLTRSALDRPDWVRNETYILAWRRSLDPSFKLFYVLLDDVKRAELENTGFNPAHLNLLQELHAKDVAGIAAEVKAQGPKGSPAAETPFEELSRKLAGFLKNLDVKAIGAIAQRLGAPSVPWRPGQQSEAVETIVARLLAGEFGAYAGLAKFINELKGDGVETGPLNIVLRWIAPHWLAPAASGRFSAVVRDLWQDKIGGNVVINGNYVVPYTTLMFVNKARPFDFQCRVAEIEAPSNKADAQYYKKQICAWLRRTSEDYEGLGDDAIVALLKKEKPFLFVPLPGRVPDKATLSTLRGWFERVIFLLWTGVQLHDVDCDAPVITLRPEVDDKREEKEYLEWRDARKAIRG